MNPHPDPIRASCCGCHHPKQQAGRWGAWVGGLAILLAALSIVRASAAHGKEGLTCLSAITEVDALLVADAHGRPIFHQNENRKCIPASTLKVLTALAVLDHFGPSHRFRTEFYLDARQRLKVKGYGDPFLVSEVLEEMAGELSSRVRGFRSLVMDNSFFGRDMVIPGADGTTNPYNAPVAAISANFNTVVFGRDKKGRIISGEKQTPLVPFARDQIKAMGLPPGRHTLFSDAGSAARYAGELLVFFLKQKGVGGDGGVHLGTVSPDDRLVYTHESAETLETLVQKMLRTSSNFMANQLFLALGASVYGPPATFAKGAEAVTQFARKKLGRNDIWIVEGSGLSRENRLSAMDMLAVLKGFRPYEDLLRKKGGVYYKTGTLNGVRARVGYIHSDRADFHYFVIFFNQPHHRIHETLRCIKEAVGRPH